MKLKALLISLLLSTPAFSKASEPVRKALASSAMVDVNSAIGGSAVAVKSYGKGTIFASNDHVCQWSRGSNFLKKKPNYTAALNTWPVNLQLISGERVRGTVIYTSNSTNPKIEKKNSRDDLCLIYVDKEVPVVKLSKEDPETGEEVFSVGAPHSLFPQVAFGGTGGYYKDKEDYFGSASLLITQGSSGGGVFFKETGELAGIAFAIAAVKEDVPAPVAAFFVPVTQVSHFLKAYESAKEQK